MAELVKQFTSGIYNLVLGLLTTGKHLGRHAVTIQYPKERWQVPERSRGMVVLLTDHETGQLNCTACLLCMKACPTGAIDIDVIKDEKNKRHLKGFKVDYNMCCFCGLCEESCNFVGIKMATKYEFPAYDKNDLVWDMNKLAAMGLDVPYEKPVRKKPAPKPAPKPVGEKAAEAAACEIKPSADKTADKAAAEPETKIQADTPESEAPGKDDPGSQEDEAK